MASSQKSNIRVCFLSQRLPQSPMGAEYGYLWPLCKKLAGRGFDVTVITKESLEGTHYSVKDGVHIHSVESKGDLGIAFRESILDRFEQLHLEKPFNLIHCVDKSGIELARHKKQLNIAVATNLKGIELDQIFGFIGLAEETALSYLATSYRIVKQFFSSFFGEDRKFLKASDGVIVTTNNEMDILERYYFVAARKLTVIPYGIDGRNFTPADTAPQVREKFGLHPDTDIILTVCPLNTYQEAKNLITAFQKVAVKKPHTALFIIGAGQRKFDLEAHVLSLALDSKVFFVENADGNEIHQYINACRIYINLFSKSSGFEQSLVEAMACAKFVMASEIGTSSQLVNSGRNGFTIRPSDVALMGRLMLQALSGELDTFELGKKAREKVLKTFDVEKMVDQTEQAYRQILKRSGKYLT